MGGETQGFVLEGVGATFSRGGKWNSTQGFVLEKGGDILPWPRLTLQPQQLKVLSKSSGPSEESPTLLHSHAVTLPYCYTPALLHSHTVTVTHCYTHTLLHSHTVTLPHCHTPALLYTHTVTLPHCYTPTLLHCYTPTLLHSHTVTLTHCYTHTLLHSPVNSVGLSSLGPDDLHSTLSCWGWRVSRDNGRMSPPLYKTNPCVLFHFPPLQNVPILLKQILVFHSPPLQNVAPPPSKTNPCASLPTSTECPSPSETNPCVSLPTSTGGRLFIQLLHIIGDPMFVDYWNKRLIKTNFSEYFHAFSASNLQTNNSISIHVAQYINAILGAHAMMRVVNSNHVC